MSSQASVFWLSGFVFFVAQTALLLLLVARGRRPGAGPPDRVEIIWTLVPASVIAALALMLGGFTSVSWTDPEPRSDPRPPLSMRWVGSQPEAPE